MKQTRTDVIGQAFQAERVLSLRVLCGFDDVVRFVDDYDTFLEIEIQSRSDVVVHYVVVWHEEKLRFDHWHFVARDIIRTHLTRMPITFQHFVFFRMRIDLRYPLIRALLVVAREKDRKWCRHSHYGGRNRLDQGSGMWRVEHIGEDLERLGWYTFDHGRQVPSTWVGTPFFWFLSQFVLFVCVYENSISIFFLRHLLTKLNITQSIWIKLGLIFLAIPFATLSLIELDVSMFFRWSEYCFGI